MSDGNISVSRRRDPSLDVFDGPVAVRVRLDISYDGTGFRGWAVQPGRRTVQQTLQDALATILRLPSVALTVAGRTDAGVHASGQVAHFELDTVRWNDLGPSLLHRLAGVLPPDVRVREVAPVPPEFDARFSAVWRRYEYRLSDADWGVEPSRRFDVLAWPRMLDVELMSAAAARLLGTHDFAAFCKRREGATSIRALQRLDVERVGQLIICRFQADAFCHSMVRSLIGSLLAVGEGRRGVEWPASLLERAQRANDVAVAPAHGLTLVEVGYPADRELAAREAVTRNVRTLKLRE